MSAIEDDPNTQNVRNAGNAKPQLGNKKEAELGLGAPGLLFATQTPDYQDGRWSVW